MKVISITLALLFISTNATAATHFTPTKYACSGIEQRIDTIKSKMRAGYSTREGEALKAELRELKDKRYACKKKGLSVE